jgi:hypothetical protein
LANLNDEQRRALRILARYLDGCAEAVLLAEGFSVGQLAVLVVDGFAEMYWKATDVGARQKNVVWMQITEEGGRWSRVINGLIQAASDLRGLLDHVIGSTE